MDKKGKSKEEIFNQLLKLQSKDLKYSDGRILGSMCTSAHPIAKEVYLNFLDSNLGDYGLFKGTKDIEDRVIAEIAKLLNGNPKSICG
ncbi:MAG: tyrosine decarboxylase MfnA, partial [Methanobacteriaceae archaeon]